MKRRRWRRRWSFASDLAVFLHPPQHGLMQGGFGVLRIFLHLVDSLRVSAIEMEDFSIFHRMILVQMARHVAPPGGPVIAVATAVGLGFGVDALMTLNFALPLADVGAEFAGVNALFVLVVADGIGSAEVVRPPQVNIQVTFPLVRLGAQRAGKALVVDVDICEGSGGGGVVERDGGRRPNEFRLQ